MANYNNNGNGFCSISKNESENTKAPFYRGFIKLSPELLQYVAEAETDAEGNVMLDVSLWRNEETRKYNGSVAIPYKAKKQQSSRAANKPAKNNVDESDDF